MKPIRRITNPVPPKKSNWFSLRSAFPRRRSGNLDFHFYRARTIVSTVRIRSPVPAASAVPRVMATCRATCRANGTCFPYFVATVISSFTGATLGCISLHYLWAGSRDFMAPIVKQKRKKTGTEKTYQFRDQEAIIVSSLATKNPSW